MIAFADELRAVAAEVHSRATKTLEVPGSGGKLAVRFKPPQDRDRLMPVVAAYRVGSSLDTAGELQLLVDCCDEILVRNGNGEHEQPEGGPLRFDAGDERWGGGVKTARDCVARLYMLDDQPLAAATHVVTLVDWMQGLETELAVRVEGESPPAAAESSSGTP